MTLFGSEALGLTAFYGIVPLALFWVFRRNLILYPLTLFWLHGLFTLSLKLNFYIPEIFAGANVHAPQWAGNLIVLAVMIVILITCAILLTSLSKLRLPFAHASFVKFFIIVSFVSFLIPALSVFTLYMKGSTDFQLFTRWLSHAFWILPALFGLLLELLAGKTNRPIHTYYLTAASIMLITGQIIFYSISAATTLSGWDQAVIALHDKSLPLSLLFYYKTYFTLGAFIFTVALAHAFWPKDTLKDNRII